MPSPQSQVIDPSTDAADHIIEIPGVGNVRFPGSLTGDALNAAAKQAYEGGQRTKHGGTTQGSRVLSEDEFNAVKQKVLDSLPAGLSEADFNRQIGPRIAQALAEAENQPSALEGSAVGRFVSNAASMLNPVAAAQGLYQAVAHPIDTLTNIGAGMAEQGRQAVHAGREGRYSEAIGHGVASALPVVGPAAAHVGEQIGSGDIAGGVGAGVGLVAPFVAVPAIKAGARAAGTMLPADAAAALESRANATFAREMAPSGSSKQIRTLGKQAERVAGAVREGTSAITPSGLHGQIADHLEAASQALDDAYDAIPKRVGHSTGPLMAKLQAAKDALYVQGTGGKVLPAAQTERAAALTQAIQEVKKIGPFTNTDNLAALRKNWKDLAKDQFVPNVNPNFKQIQGAAKGWADAYTQLQDVIVGRHQELGPLNADYHIWKQASDVMTALEDRERVRPAVGRTMLASGVGMAAKGTVGALIAPLLERGITGTVAPAMKLSTARGLGSLAKLLRANAPPAAIQSAVERLKPTLLKLAAQEQITSPTGSQNQTTASAWSQP